MRKSDPVSSIAKLPAPMGIIERRIYLIRGFKVMLDRDLADLYQVQTKVFNQAVKRNRARFPKDFMFRLTIREAKAVRISRSQFVTLKQGQNIKYAPYAFTQEGVAMLSSALNSERAVRVNIEIMRAFVRVRELAATHRDLLEKIDAMEKKYDGQFQMVFDAIRGLMQPPHGKTRPIGFITGSLKK